MSFFHIAVFNDGSSRELMSLAGTVPVSYRGKWHLEAWMYEVCHVMPDFKHSLNDFYQK